MAKDYKHRVYEGDGRPFPLWKFLITGLFIAAFVGFLLFIDRTPEPSTPVAKPSVEDSEPSPASSVPESPSRFDYEFYTLLPQKELYSPRLEEPVPLPKPAAEPPSVPESVMPATKADAYLLQVVSSRDAAKAESLQVKLLLLGFDVRVERAVIARQTWHRVRVGPYRSREQLKSARAKLKQNGFEAIVVKAKG